MKKLSDLTYDRAKVIVARVDAGEVLPPSEAEGALAVLNELVEWLDGNCMVQAAIELRVIIDKVKEMIK